AARRMVGSGVAILPRAAIARVRLLPTTCNVVGKCLVFPCFTARLTPLARLFSASLTVLCCRSEAPLPLKLSLPLSTQRCASARRHSPHTTDHRPHRICIASASASRRAPHAVACRAPVCRRLLGGWCACRAGA